MIGVMLWAFLIVLVLNTVLETIRKRSLHAPLNFMCAAMAGMSLTVGSQSKSNYTLQAVALCAALLVFLIGPYALKSVARDGAPP